MRLVVLIAFALALVACERQGPPRGKQATGALPDRPTEALAGVSTVSVPETKSCGGSCGSTCGGPQGCGGSCGGAMAAAPTEAPAVPADAVWTELHVAGMRCGGCAKRIRGALARIDGVLGVEVDLATARVRVATAAGVDVRSVAAPAIDSLGYQVQ